MGDSASWEFPSWEFKASSHRNTRVSFVCRTPTINDFIAVFANLKS